MIVSNLSLGFVADICVCINNITDWFKFQNKIEQNPPNYLSPKFTIITADAYDIWASGELSWCFWQASMSEFVYQYLLALFVLCVPRKSYIRRQNHITYTQINQLHTIFCIKRYRTKHLLVKTRVIHLFWYHFDNSEVFFVASIC